MALPRDNVEEDRHTTEQFVAELQALGIPTHSMPARLCANTMARVSRKWAMYRDEIGDGGPGYSRGPRAALIAALQDVLGNHEGSDGDDTEELEYVVGLAANELKEIGEMRELAADKLDHALFRQRGCFGTFEDPQLQRLRINIHLRASEHAKAQRRLERYIPIAEVVHGPYSLEVFRAFRQIIHVLTMQKKPGQAETWVEKYRYRLEIMGGPHQKQAEAAFMSGDDSWICKGLTLDIPEMDGPSWLAGKDNELDNAKEIEREKQQAAIRDEELAALRSKELAMTRKKGVSTKLH